MAELKLLCVLTIPTVTREVRLGTRWRDSQLNDRVITAEKRSCSWEQGDDTEGVSQRSKEADVGFIGVEVLAPTYETE